MPPTPVICALLTPTKETVEVQHAPSVVLVVPKEQGPHRKDNAKVSEGMTFQSLLLVLLLSMQGTCIPIKMFCRDKLLRKFDLLS